MEMLRIFTRSVGVYLFLNQKQSIVCVFSLHILILLSLSVSPYAHLSRLVSLPVLDSSELQMLFVDKDNYFNDWINRWYLLYRDIWS